MRQVHEALVRSYVCSCAELNAHLNVALRPCQSKRVEPACHATADGFTLCSFKNKTCAKAMLLCIDVASLPDNLYAVRVASDHCMAEKHINYLSPALNPKDICSLD